MDQEETDFFIRTFRRLNDGWDMRAIIGVYLHLPLQEAMVSCTRDLANYVKIQEAMKAEKAIRVTTEIQ